VKNGELELALTELIRFDPASRVSEAMLDPFRKNANMSLNSDPTNSLYSSGRRRTGRDDVVGRDERELKHGCVEGRSPTNWRVVIPWVDRSIDSLVAYLGPDSKIPSQCFRPGS